jgi:hypothetical protein
MIIMKKLSILLIGCSLALAGAALAQQPDEQQQTSKGKRAPEKAHAAQTQPGGSQKAHVPQAQGGPTKETGAMKQHGAPNEHAATSQPGEEKGLKTHAGHQPPNAPETNVATKPSGDVRTEHGAGKDKKGQTHQQSANAPAKETDVSGGTAGMPTQVGKEKQVNQQGGKRPLTETGAAPPAPATGQQNVQANAAGAKAKKPAPQQVQQVKSQHANFHAQPKPQQVQPVTFNQNHRIEGSDQWQGAQYETFRSYHSEWHDAGWYHSHYPNVALIAGGYYFFNNGYWFPAWGYSPSAQYYAYDGPIYAGHHAEPPDKVIAETQALLQQMGYYKGEVDGLLGPLTREALTAYQADQGLATTAAIDQPTLDSLGLA